MVYWVYLFALIFFGFFVVINDFKYRKIPNSFLIFFLLLFVALRLALDQQLGLPFGVVPSWSQAGLGFIGGLCVFFPFWLIRQMGAADVKLIAVLGFVLGWQAGISVVLGGSILAAGHALALVLIPNLEKKYGFSLPGSRVKARSIPLGAWLAVALLGWLWIQLYIES